MAELRHVICSKCESVITVDSLRRDGLCSACKRSREFYKPYPEWTPGFFQRLAAALRERFNKCV